MPNSPIGITNDAGITADVLSFLHDDEAGKLLLVYALALVRTNSASSVSAVAKLRKTYSADQVRAALAIAESRVKATNPGGKFADLSPSFELWTVPEALEQATDPATARHKATRFAAASPTHPIADFCAGIGGDTIALAAVAPTLAVDWSSVRTQCLRWNADQLRTLHPVTVLADDLRNVLASLPPDSLFHIDPARRSAGQRLITYADLIPGPDVISNVINHFHTGGGCLKLSSAMDFDELPPGHLELISRKGTVVQACLWVGSMTRLFPANTRTATIITPTGATSFTAPIATLFTTNEIGPYVYEIDGAFTRAGIAAPFAESLGLSPLTTDGGYATGPAPSDHPAVVPFRVLHVTNVNQVPAALKSLQAEASPGPIEVKTRGKLPGIDTDKLQKAWTAAAPVKLTVLIARIGDEPRAIIAKR